MIIDWEIQGLELLLKEGRAHLEALLGAHHDSMDFMESDGRLSHPEAIREALRLLQVVTLEHLNAIVDGTLVILALYLRLTTAGQRQLITLGHGRSSSRSSKSLARFVPDS